MLEQDITKKKRVDENKGIDLDVGDNNSEKYKVEGVYNNMAYARELKSGHLLGFYYLIFWKDFSKKENIWEPVLTIQHLRKLISLFYKNHPNKPK